MKIAYTAEQLPNAARIASTEGCYLAVARIGTTEFATPLALEGANLAENEESGGFDIQLTTYFGKGAGTASMGMCLITLDLQDEVECVMVKQGEQA